MVLKIVQGLWEYQSQSKLTAWKCHFQSVQGTVETWEKWRKGEAKKPTPTKNSNVLSLTCKPNVLILHYAHCIASGRSKSYSSWYWRMKALIPNLIFHASVRLSAEVSYHLRANPSYWNRLLITLTGLTRSTRLNISTSLLAPVATVSTYPLPMNLRTAVCSGHSAPG